MDTGPLRKILEIERARGCADSAVIGGLDGFLRNWAGSALPSVSDADLRRRFARLGLDRPDYASMTPDQRRAWIEDLLRLLADTQKSEPDMPVPGGPQPEGGFTGKDDEPRRRFRAMLDSTGETGAAGAQPTAPRPGSRRSRHTRKAPSHSLEAPITALRGISVALQDRFSKLGVRCIRDLLYFFPHRHLDYSRHTKVSDLVPGEEQTIVANVWQAGETRPGGRRSTEAVVGDETGNVRVVWFNNPHVARQLAPNMRIVLSGRVRVFNGRHVFESPEWEAEDSELVHTGRLVPVYPLTRGLHMRQVRRLMKGFVGEWAPLVADFLPAQVRERCALLDLPEAIAQAHYPDDEAIKDRARLRLAFDELFLLQLGVLARKREWQAQLGAPVPADHETLRRFTGALPFSLTGAQHRALGEMLADLERPQPMTRLLQGEVGSGKTVIATAGLLTATAAGRQGAMMAPTEILAEQHFATICRLLEAVGRIETETDHVRTYSGILPRPLTIALLMGATRAARKRDLHRRILAGEIDLVVGTHALIQKEVEFRQLALAVVDEQHRFGVEQRSTLRQKGFNPHVLVMTATPIPRTLALTLYGDLDLSVLDELPPGRQPIRTRWLRPDQRRSAYAFLRREVSAGHQAFVICPLVEESEAVQARAATAEHQRLSHEVFPDLRIGLLHGRMSARDKEKTMRRFHAGEMHMLVSTAVVEVGIDVPNATVMIVESADRFGLSQLHQFRGRVGRGQAQSYCMLMAEAPSELGQQRLDIIESVQDGFRLAEEDLRLRGPGEFFGTRQSGLPDLRMAQLTDVPLLEMARAEATRLFEEDRDLRKPEHAALVTEMKRVWSGEEGEWS